MSLGPVNFKLLSLASTCAIASNVRILLRPVLGCHTPLKIWRISKYLVTKTTNQFCIIHPLVCLLTVGGVFQNSFPSRIETVTMYCTAHLSCFLFALFRHVFLKYTKQSSRILYITKNVYTSLLVVCICLVIFYNHRASTVMDPFLAFTAIHVPKPQTLI